MKVEVRVPQFGMTMHEATIVSWYKKVGEPVVQGEPIAELETDKVTVELEAPASGVLAAIQVQVGSTVPVFELVAIIEASSPASGSGIVVEQSTGIRP